MKLVTIKEVTDCLKVNKKTLYDWARRGDMPCYKLNGVLRFDLEKVQAWVESREIKPPPLCTPRRKPLKKKDIDETVKRIIASCKNQDYDSSQRGNRTNHARKGVK